MRKSDWFLLMLTLTTLVALVLMCFNIEGFVIPIICLQWIWLVGEMYYLKKEREEHRGSVVNSKEKNDGV